MYRLLLILLLLSFSSEVWSAQRIVLLAPAAGDIIHKLGADGLVVGVTRNLTGFDKATKVGSHIRPNIEVIRSLHPDMLIISSNRFFSQEMAAVVGAKVFYYHPKTLDQIAEQTSKLAEELGKPQQGEKLISCQWKKLENLKPISVKPKVVFEVIAMPLVVAGSQHIVADMIKRAGGEMLILGQRKMVRFNAEGILARQPDIYIYQVGPMNKNPRPPAQRSSFRNLRAKFLQVAELQFSRANTTTFDNVVKLNRFFSGDPF